MKPDLQRIEAALNQIGKQIQPPPPHAPATAGLESPAPSTGPSSSPLSFKVRSNAASHPPASAAPPVNGEQFRELTSVCPALDASSSPVHAHASYNPLLSLEASRAPALPRLEISDFNSLSYDSERVLQMIRGLEAIVAGWQTELHQIVQRIRAVEGEGPAINGWLESQSSEDPTPDVSVLRHADVDQLMAYVNEICHPLSGVAVPKNRYLLCGYNADGQIWSRPCTPEELSGVSMAIARYQTLSQLRERQQSLERRLGAIALQVTQMYQHYAG